MPIPRLIILNQMAGPLTRELAEDLAVLVGPSILFTGHQDTLRLGNTPNLVVYPASRFRRETDWQRLTSWGRYLLQAFTFSLRNPARSYLLLFSNPPFLPFAGYLLRRLRRQSYAIIVHDIYPDLLTRLGRLSERSLVTRLWRWMNRLAFENADAVMTLGQAMAKELQHQFRTRDGHPGRVEVIHPWADASLIRPLPKQENWFAQQYGLVDKLTIMYSGNMGASHDIETILAASERLQTISNVHFVFIGAGAKWKLVDKFMRSHKPPNLTLLPWQPEEVILYSLSAADVALVSLDAGAEGLAFPSKSIYAMAAGSALIGLSSDDSDLEQLITRYQCGLNVHPGNVDQLVASICRFRDDPGFLAQARRSARQAAEEVYSRKLNVLAVYHVINQFMQDRGPD